jgi:hypothetical protein
MRLRTCEQRALLPKGSVDNRPGVAIKLVDLATHFRVCRVCLTISNPADWSNPYAHYGVANLYAHLLKETYPVGQRVVRIHRSRNRPARGARANLPRLAAGTQLPANARNLRFLMTANSQRYEAGLPGSPVFEREILGFSGTRAE